MKTDTIRNIALAGAALTLLGVTVGASAFAQDDFVRNTDATTRACFRVDQVEGYSPVRFAESVRGVNLKIRGDVYQVEFATPCPSLPESTRIQLRGKTPGYVCNGSDIEVITYSEIASSDVCRASGLRKIEKSDLASLPAKERP